MLYQKEREEMCEVVKAMFDRDLTNAAGGNLSERMNKEHFIMTPTLMAQQQLCKLEPEDILVVDKELNVIEGRGKVTREINMHMAIYEVSDSVKTVIHAHPKEAMVFACLGLEIEHLCENTVKLGKVETLPFSTATTEELAKTVKDYMTKRKDELEKHPIAALLNKHGIILADKSGLKAAYDVLERIEYEAYVNIQAKLLRLTEHIDLSDDRKLNYNMEE